MSSSHTPQLQNSLLFGGGPPQHPAQPFMTPPYSSPPRTGQVPSPRSSVRKYVELPRLPLSSGLPSPISSISSSSSLTSSVYGAAQGLATAPSPHRTTVAHADSRGFFPSPASTWEQGHQSTRTEAPRDGPGRQQLSDYYAHAMPAQNNIKTIMTTPLLIGVTPVEQQAFPSLSRPGIALHSHRTKSHGCGPCASVETLKDWVAGRRKHDDPARAVDRLCPTHIQIVHVLRYEAQLKEREKLYGKQ
ncbi:hypothetical protein BKA62DRAFT_673790 [Auriculariales sp. MPI-PUGE-AT-0066]|nr:hypothetical protein BKA62DRAFT_673790 [Auriculariales sp. MPI-PUGE-AT-0066]